MPQALHGLELAQAYLVKDKEKIMTKQVTITFIGSGNMAQSLIGGLLQDGYKKNQLCVADISEPLLEQVASQFGVQTFLDNKKAVIGSDVVVLAVKPFHIKEVLTGLNLKKGTLILSIAAGILIKDLEIWSGAEHSIVRCMPNTPSLVQSGAAGLIANSHVNKQQKDWAESILRAVGITVWLENESLIDAVTAVSGSGPAYYFMFMEAMIESAIKMGLSKKQAQLLTKQTAFGAAKMALESQDEPHTLRQNVTSKNGTTEKALDTFKENNINDIVNKAMLAAQKRSKIMAQELGE